MKERIILLFIALISTLPAIVSAQQITQTVRGVIIDHDNNMPLPGATVSIVGTDPLIGTVTDAEGKFRLTGVPVGRVTLKISFVGYEEKMIPNLLVSSAKEEVLNVSLEESVSTLEEVTVTGNNQRGEAQNEMATVSAHTFSVEETSRYAGSFDDPARMVSGFAGVSMNAEGSNEIIVRGNSPKGILWKLEGIAIPNPNHFASEGSTGGPINALSSKMLSTSDFYSGAFAPEYGDATSGVFDMRLKGGNNEKREYTASVSTLGLDMTAEGPIKEGQRSSYIANYRYSALDLLDKAGVVDFGGVPRYQDLSFKVQLIPNNKHSFSIFGLGGASGIDTEDTEEENEDVITGKFNGRNKVGVLGLNHMYQLNDDMYLRSSLAATGTDNDYRYAIPDQEENFYDIEKGLIRRTSFIASSSFNYKVNSRHKVEAGFIITQLGYRFNAYEYDFEKKELLNELSDDGNSSMMQFYASWKYRLSEKWTMINGLHYLHFNLNSNFSIEPRIALKWQQNEKQSFSFGAGLHSKLEPLSTYLVKHDNGADGITQPNKDLEITKAMHLVLGYNRQLSPTTNFKFETYYQHLFDVPVENDVNSAFSLLNRTEGYTSRSLINEGTGRNYGAEFTFERYLSRGLYYMTTLSLFRSMYTPLDGIERKSTFDNNYVANFIGGKEFSVGNAAKNKVLFLNAKIGVMGGKRYSPIDLEASRELGNEVIDELHPFSRKGSDVFRTDFSVGLRRNRKHVTTELKFDVQNILNNRVVVGEEYVHATGSISKFRQLGLLPTLSYKISF